MLSLDESTELVGAYPAPASGWVPSMGLGSGDVRWVWVSGPVLNVVVVLVVWKTRGMRGGRPARGWGWLGAFHGPTLRRLEMGVDLQTGACGGFGTCGLGDPGDAGRETRAGLGATRPQPHPLATRFSVSKLILVTFDVSGRIVTQREVHNHEQLDVGSLVNGVYAAKLISQSESETKVFAL